MCTIFPLLLFSTGSNNICVLVFMIPTVRGAGQGINQLQYSRFSQHRDHLVFRLNFRICLPFSFAWSSHIGISIYFRFAKYSYGLISSNKDGFKTNFSLKQKN